MRKKQLILLFLIILGIGLALPYLCSAIEYDWQFFTGITALKTLWSWLGDLGGLIDKPIAYAIQAVVFSILTSVSSIFLFLSQDLLNFVTSSNFINIGFTHNDFVDVGLGITKNLGNIIIILSLVVIALATILKRKEYEAQKTIPILILVALLINFSPVICGVIIDGSNITMNYFLDGGALKRDVAGTLWEQLKQITSYTGFSSESERFGVGIVFVVFNVVVSLVFFLFAMLFAARHVALWILVIISPLAFACYILKFTRKYFALWWNQFFQWSIIGIPAAFTLYLANTIIMMAEEGKLTGAVTGDYLSSFGIIAQYIIPVTFLVAGFFMSLQTGAMGANIITGFFEKQVKGAGALAWKGTKSGTEKALRRPRAWIGRELLGGTSKFIEELGKEKLGRERTMLAGWAARMPGPIGSAMGWSGRKLVANVARHEREEIEKAEKDAEGKSFEEQDVLVHSSIASRRTGTLHTIYKEGNIDRYTKATEFSEEDKEKIMQDTLKFFPSRFKDFAKSEAEIAQKIVGKFGEKIDEELAKRIGVFMDKKDITKFGTLAEKLVSTANEKDISKWSENTMVFSLESEVFHKSLKGSKISAMAKQFGDVFFETFKNNVKTKKWYEQNAPAAAKYIESSAGKSLGIGSK